MSGEPLVSIIIPTYNRSQWLARAIESCLSQTYPHIEVIVIDDGSKDTRAKEIASCHPNVIYYYQENQGSGAARNTGLALSKGEYIQFLDDDDLLAEHAIDSKVSRFHKAPVADVVYSDIFIIDEQETIHGTFFQDRIRPLPVGDIYTSLLWNNFIPLHALLWKRQSLIDAGGFPRRSVLEDWECLLRTAEHSNFDFIDEPLGCYRLHHQNISIQFESQASAYAEVHQWVAASNRFLELPRALKIRLLCKFALKQLAEGDRVIGQKFLKNAISIGGLHPLPYLLWGFSKLGQSFNRQIVRNLWRLRAKLFNSSNTRDYFMQKAGVI